MTTSEPRHVFIYDGLRPDIADPEDEWKFPFLEQSIARDCAYLSGFNLYDAYGTATLREATEGSSSSSSAESSTPVVGFAIEFAPALMSSKIKVMDALMSYPKICERRIVPVEIPASESGSVAAYVYITKATGPISRISSNDWKTHYESKKPAQVESFQILSASDDPPFFSVSPKTDCPHVEEYDLPEERLSVKLPCEVCANVGENWICISCLSVCCSRYVKGHMSQHYQETKHPIVISFSDLSVWCYECDSYIASKNIRPILLKLHDSKFGRS
eukprot:TRINITY_DN4163_c0_g1_i5.p1 TRINITY_DN4163_c0_g1~~TRINITY_DN4163_c0_g1_i5.p1  ORF type:complete len:274 (+),score=59.73 TRINITY_DN4163_c0_g1_i5:80-901(+)